jgi:hypothetical protein
MMTRTTLPIVLVILTLGAPASWSQQETPAGAPFGEQAPPQQGEDPFGNSDPASARGANASKNNKQGNSPANSPGKFDPTPAFLTQKLTQYSERIMAALEGPLTEGGLNFTDTPLSEVVSFLRDEYKIEVQLDTQALDDLGLSPDDTVTANIRHVSLASGLKLLLRQHDLTYIIADEVLLITSEDEALSRLSVRVYPVGDLLQPKEGHAQTSAASADDLIDTIISLVASDTWAENGGGEADIRALQPGLLVVSQTQAVHEEIANLLMALRRARQHELALPYTPASKRPSEKTLTGGIGGAGGFGGGGHGGGGSSEAHQN